jgi:hypothetical protein
MIKALAALLFLLVAALPGTAQAGVFVSFGFPFFPFFPAPYYPPPAYYYPPAPPYYYPSAQAAPAAAPAAVTPSATTGNCKTFKGNATIDGSHQPFYGTACLGADRKWHIQP